MKYDEFCYIYPYSINTYILTYSKKKNKWKVNDIVHVVFELSVALIKILLMLLNYIFKTILDIW